MQVVPLLLHKNLYAFSSAPSCPPHTPWPSLGSLLGMGSHLPLSLHSLPPPLSPLPSPVSFLAVSTLPLHSTQCPNVRLRVCSCTSPCLSGPCVSVHFPLWFEQGQYRGRVPSNEQDASFAKDSWRGKQYCCPAEKAYFKASRLSQKRTLSHI